MNLSQFETMNPIMLMSIVNMKIRDEYETLDSLVQFYEIDKNALIAHLKDAGFDYRPDIEQFR